MTDSNSPLSEDLKTIAAGFQTPAGQRALKVLDTLFYEPLSYQPGDIHATVFREGHRDVLKFIHNCLEL